MPLPTQCGQRVLHKGRALRLTLSRTRLLERIAASLHTRSISDIIRRHSSRSLGMIRAGVRLE